MAVRPYPPQVLSEAEAVSAVQQLHDEPAHGARLQAVRQGERLWSVTLVDADGGASAGGAWLVGPDYKVFSISSNPGIHDWRLAIRLLDAVYAADVAEAVEPAAFEKRLRTVTQEREALAKQVLAEARAGTLRTVTRHLP